MDQYKREYYKKNRDRILQRMREYYKNHGQAHYLKHAEKKRAAARDYWKNNPEKRKRHYERRQERYKTSENARLTRNETARRGMAKLRAVIFNHYGNQCECCGELQNEFLSIDHINGCSRELRKEQGSGNALYRWLKRHNFPDGYQVLCFNCNMAKGFLGICPHMKERIRQSA